jgi:hypothetical protein
MPCTREKVKIATPRWRERKEETGMKRSKNNGEKQADIYPKSSYKRASQ